MFERLSRRLFRRSAAKWGTVRISASLSDRHRAGGNPFAPLAEIDNPVCVATAEKSWPIYQETAARAVALIPAASQWKFDGVGHCVAQEAPG